MNNSVSGLWLPLAGPAVALQRAVDQLRRAPGASDAVTRPHQQHVGCMRSMPVMKTAENSVMLV